MAKSVEMMSLAKATQLSWRWPKKNRAEVHRTVAEVRLMYRPVCAGSWISTHLLAGCSDWLRDGGWLLW